MKEYYFAPRGIGENWIKCFICGSIKDGYIELNENNDPTKETKKKSELNENGIHYTGWYHSCQPDMASFVLDSELEEVSELFSNKKLNIFVQKREDYENVSYIKIGACKKHLKNLELLYELTRINNKINMKIIKKSIDYDIYKKITWLSNFQKHIDKWWKDGYKI